MSGFTQVFGGSAVNPAQPSYLPLTLDGGAVALQWPLEASQTAVPTVAAVIDLNPTTTGTSVTMPDATTGSLGGVSIISNVGANSTTIKDADGNQIVVIATTVSYLLVLTDNTTTAGSWRTYQLASTSSSGVASALAGYGLEAVGSQLQVDWSAVAFTGSRTIAAADRMKLLEFTGSSDVTVQLGTLAALGTGFSCVLQNSSASANVLLATSGGNLINGEVELNILPGENAIIIGSVSQWVALGFLVGTLPISQGGTGSNTAGTALINLGGGTTGIQIFEAATAAAVLTILGLTQSTFTESTVSTNQALSTTSTNTMFVCTAAVTMTLPLTTSLGKTFVVGAYAQGGAVTWTPQGTDSINGLTAGSNFIVPAGSSVMMMTDANGNWWPFFVAAGATGTSWAIAGGTANALTATYTPPITALADGLLVWLRAAAASSSTTPTLNVDGLGAKTITRNGGDALQVSDIPAAGAELILRYNLANTRWELLNPAAPPLTWGVAGGTVDAITVTTANDYNQIRNGILIGFRAAGANTSTTPTLNVNSAGAITITKNGGQALKPGDIPGANAEIIVRYNSVTATMEMVSVIPREVQWVAAGGTADAITATYAPAVVAVYDGLLLAFRASAANTSTTPTFAPNGLTARTITKLGGGALVVGDIPAANAEVLVRYNLANTRWELLNPGTPSAAQSAASNGYLRLAGGFLFQWGSGSTTLGSGSITYPIPFPNNVYSVMATITGGAAATNTVNPILTGTPGLSTCAVWGSAAQSVGFQWFAIGN